MSSEYTPPSSSEGSNRKPLATPFVSLPEIMENATKPISSALVPERGFYEEIARIARGPFRDQMLALCHAWLACTRADFVWLWHLNSITSRWELIGNSTKKIGADPELPETFFLESRNSVTEYTIKMGIPIFVDKIKSWKQRLDGETYTVVSSKRLESLGCNAFCCVPFLPPRQHDGSNHGSNNTKADTVLCFHAASAKQISGHDPDVLLLKGRMSLYFIESAKASHQRSLLQKLYLLAAPHLRQLSRDPRVSRKDYAQNLLNFLKSELGMRYGSIFFEDNSQTLLECVATTGLYDLKDAYYGEDDLDDIIYEKDEGRTWQVYEEGKPVISSLLEGANSHKGKFREIPPDEEEQRMPWLIYPIADQPANVNGPELRCSGVIRWSGLHEKGVKKKRSREFQPTDIQDIDIIASHSGMVLQILTGNINRDIQVASVKHDLQAPLILARDTSLVIESHVNAITSLIPSMTAKSEEKIAYESSSKILINRTKDVSAAVSIGLLLVSELDRDPLERITVEPQETTLEADVIAPLAVSFRNFAKQFRRMDVAFFGFNELPLMKLDKFQMWRAVGNLLMNAIKYGKPGSRVSVTGFNSREQKSIIIAVQNDGIGVKPSDQERIFRGNYRAPEAQELTMGEGLGLKITEKIVRLHGGKLELTQARNPTVFSIVLPRSRIFTG